MLANIGYEFAETWQLLSLPFFCSRTITCRRLAIRDVNFAALNQLLIEMKREKYAELFVAFGQAPMEDFLKLLFKGVSAEARKLLVLEDVAYHRMNADIVALDAWMCVSPVESNQWIWARVEMNGASGAVEEQFFTKDNYRQQALASLAECIDYYKKEDKQ